MRVYSLRSGVGGDLFLSLVDDTNLDKCEISEEFESLFVGDEEIQEAETRQPKRVCHGEDLDL